MGQVHNRRALLPTRRRLRNHGTPAEAALWLLLRGRALGGRKFRRQHSVGPYVLDFYCPSERLAVELDGPAHDDDERYAYDAERSSYLASARIRVIRFQNPDVITRPDDVLAAIAAHFTDGARPAGAPPTLSSP